MYWLRLTNAKSHRLLSHLYRHRAAAVDRGEGELSWCKSMKELLCEWDLAELWDRKQSGADTMSQEESDCWRANVEELSRSRDLDQRDKEVKSLSTLTRYSTLPLHPQDRVQPYLHDRYNIKGTWIKLRLRINNLMLMDRMAPMLKWPVAGRRCPMCATGAKEDVSHFLLHCTAYARERETLRSMLRDRVSYLARDEFVTGDDDTKIAMLLGTESGFLFSDPEESAKARYAMDKVSKTFMRACWRIRERKMGKFRLRYRDRKVYLAVDKEWKPSEPLEESIARAVTDMNRTELSAAGVADALIGDGGWKEWVVREPLMDWRTVKTNRRRKYFTVWDGRKCGVFYKWSDCWNSIKFYPEPEFKGFETLAEARSAMESE